MTALVGTPGGTRESDVPAIVAGCGTHVGDCCARAGHVAVFTGGVVGLLVEPVDDVDDGAAVDPGGD